VMDSMPLDKAIERGISVGRGGVWLMLTGEQYGTLKIYPLNWASGNHLSKSSCIM
jgi:hypothetical protein